MNIAYIPSSKIYLNNELFSNKNERDNVREPFIFLKKYCKKQNWNLNTIDLYSDLSQIDIALAVRFDANIRILLKIIKANPKVKIIYIHTEQKNIAPLHDKIFLKNPLFDAVLTWDDRFIDGNYFIKYFLFNPFRKMVNTITFNKKKFLCMIYSYKTKGKDKKGDIYQERFNIINYFGPKGKLDIYGIGWEKAKDKKIKKNYKGSVKSKIAILKNYKFAIAFENSKNEKGAISEKIFDVMAAGCVPIYLGAPNVLDFIPGDTFIDCRKFADYSELENFLNKITEKEYNNYIESIKSFLESEKYIPFTSYGFVEKVSYAIRKVTQLEPSHKSIFKIKWFFIKKIIANMYFFWKYYKRFVYEIVFK